MLNSTKTWQEETEKQLDELEEDAGDIGHHTIVNYVIRRERVNKFISDLRTSLLDSLETEVLDHMEKINKYAKDNRSDYETVNEANFAYAQLKEVINIINSHR